MFTGLVEALGELVERTPTSGGFRVRIGTPLAAELSPGDSLAVNGVCLTVVTSGSNEIQADVGPETVRATTFGTIAQGSTLNLERPLRADGRVGGHFVQGHVDGVGVIEELRADAGFHRVTIGFPPALAPYFVQKGSVAVDGISLTVAALGVDRFEIMIVPFTMSHTNLGRARARDRVNLEADMVGKYVVRAAELAGLSLAADRQGR
jgi:riboflavin synthase